LQLVDAAGGLDVAASGVAAASIPNVYGGGSMLLVVNPRLVGDYDDHYYYFDTTLGASAVQGFEMRSVEAHEQTAMDGDSRFERDEFKFSLEADVVFGAGAWQVTHGGIL
jgi:phage major head subunit gpT-like protein